MDSTSVMLNEKYERRINRLINRANQESEFISPILKRQMNPIIIQNNHAIMYSLYFKTHY